MSDRTLQVTATLSASPEQVFALLSNPNRHTDLDGAGMLRGVEGDGAPVRAVGDEFTMNMHQDSLGDYRMRNEVVEFEPDRRIAWAPSIDPPGALDDKIGDLKPVGHVFRWELSPAAGGTTVTHTYDWSGVADEKTVQALFPLVSEADLKGSLDRLGKSV